MLNAAGTTIVQVTHSDVNASFGSRVTVCHRAARSQSSRGADEPIVRQALAGAEFAHPVPLAVVQETAPTSATGDDRHGAVRENIGAAAELEPVAVANGQEKPSMQGCVAQIWPRPSPRVGEPFRHRNLDTAELVCGCGILEEVCNRSSLVGVKEHRVQVWPRQRQPKDDGRERRRGQGDVRSNPHATPRLLLDAVFL